MKDMYRTTEKSNLSSPAALLEARNRKTLKATQEQKLFEESFLVGSVTKKTTKNQLIKFNPMKINNQITKVMATLLLVVAGMLGAKAQVDGLPKTGDVTVCFGATEDYAVEETSGSIYTWSITPTTGGVITGNTNKISVNWTTQGTYTLEVIEKNSMLCEGEPVKITITVLPKLIAGTISEDQTVCYNTAPKTLTSVDPTGGTGTYTYQWESSIDGGTTWGDIAGATAADYSPAALTTTTHYRLKQTSEDCGTVTTNQVIITIQQELIAGTASEDQTVCYNTVPEALTSVAPTGGTGTFTYQWESSIDGGTTWGDIAGATSSEYSPAALTATTHYRLKQTSESCGTVTTNQVIITVMPLPVITLDGPSPVCEAKTSNVYTTEAGMTKYVWEISAGGTITAGGQGTNNTVTVTWNTAGPQTVSVNYENENGCTAATPTVTNVTVSPLPVTSTIFHK